MFAFLSFFSWFLCFFFFSLLTFNKYSSNRFFLIDDCLISICFCFCFCWFSSCFFFLNNLWLWSYIYKHKRTQLHTLEFTVCTQTKVNAFWLANFREKKLHKIPFLRFRNRCKHLDDIGSGEKLNFLSMNLFFCNFYSHTQKKLEKIKNTYSGERQWLEKKKNCIFFLFVFRFLLYFFFVVGIFLFSYRHKRLAITKFFNLVHVGARSYSLRFFVYLRATQRDR